MNRWVLKDEQWERVAPLLPGKAGDPGRTGSDNRRFLEAVLWMVRTGAPWRDLPAMFGNWNSVFRRFRRWAQTSIFEQVFQALSGDPDFEYALIDGTIIRVHQHGTGAKGGLGHQAIGRSRGGLTTKIVALVDALGNLADFLLLPGQRHDSVGAEPLLDGVEIGALIADKGFDNDALRQALDARGAIAVIPPKANRVRQIACDFAMYRWRHLVENFFCDLKQFRRVATRYDKTDQSFEAMIYLAASFMALK
ncbi:IS5 family transposase [Microvirga aerilata]|uniref:IS5 family transposase n=2 Tax=Microvirga aerilata TaxID=670292 RepID=A0A936ZQ44_9HYPH|nr:IS5 family transposase [Microvirga aerilata]MBL0408608.1 IS5 family transposase [Microvirga aerilata]